MKRLRNGRRPRLAGLVAGLLLLGLVTAACGNGVGANKSKPIVIGHTTWPEDTAVAYLWHEILEQRGYQVKLRQRQVDEVFAGMAAGDIDLFMDTWRPRTHGGYWRTYEGQLISLGRWYDKATLELAVPDYMKADSIGDLEAYAEQLGGIIVGIELDAGITEIIKEDVLREYGLRNDLRYVSSSTPVMLESLRTALANGEPIVVALWHPHWAYETFPIKDLEDPKDVWKKSELEDTKNVRKSEDDDLYVTARKGFPEDHPRVARWIRDFELKKTRLPPLVADVHDAESPRDKQRAVERWIAHHRELVVGWAGPSD